MEFSRRRLVQIPDTLFRSDRQDGGFRHPRSRGSTAPRHAGLFAAIHRLDTQLDQATRSELTRWLRDQYENGYGDIPLGFVASCHLGPPYVDHRLDLFHSIVQHYAPADVMPDPFAAARMLVRTAAYAFVEVYADGTLRPVFPDGSVVD